MPDFELQKEGTIFLLHPMNDKARQWVNDNIGTAETQMFGDAVVVEQRFIEQIVFGILNDGLEI